MNSQSSSFPSATVSDFWRHRHFDQHINAIRVCARPGEEGFDALVCASVERMDKRAGELPFSFHSDCFETINASRARAAVWNLPGQRRPLQRTKTA